MFLVVPSCVKMNRLRGDPTLEQATYSWPCEKQGCSKLIPATFRDCPWALLIVMAKANLMGNCRRLKLKGRSLGMMGILGMKTFSPLPHPVRIVASIRFESRALIMSRVPLQSFGLSRLRRSIIGVPIFK